MLLNSKEITNIDGTSEGNDATAEDDDQREEVTKRPVKADDQLKHELVSPTLENTESVFKKDDSDAEPSGAQGVKSGCFLERHKRRILALCIAGIGFVLYKKCNPNQDPSESPPPLPMDEYSDVELSTHPSVVLTQVAEVEENVPQRLTLNVPQTLIVPFVDAHAQSRAPQSTQPRQKADARSMQETSDNEDTDSKEVTEAKSTTTLTAVVVKKKTSHIGWNREKT